MSESDLKVFVVWLAAIQVTGGVLVFASKKKAALAANALQPLLILVGALFAIRPTGYETPKAAELMVGFLLFELLLLGACIVWIRRRQPSFWFFWASWVANLLPLALLGYMAFFFRIF